MKNPDLDPAHSEEWDDLFRQRFADFQSEPPADALRRILADLADSAPAPAPQSIGGRGKWWLLGLGGLFLLVGTMWLNRSEPMSATLLPKALSVPSLKAQPVERIPSTNVPSRSAEHSVGSASESSIAAKAPKPAEAKQVGKASQEAGEPIGGAFDRSETKLVTSQTLPQAKLPQAALRSSGMAKELSRQVEPLPNMDTPSNTLETKDTRSVSVNEPAALAPRRESWQSLTLLQLAGRPLQTVPIGLNLPTVSETSLTQPTAPQKPSVQRLRPVVFGSVMPLYTYQRINPVQDDGVLVKQISTQKALSTQRMGIRLQAGVEWPLARRLALRTSVTYNQLSQQLSYLTQNSQPDSVRVERINVQTVRLTPYFNDKQVSSRTNWHYIGLGADVVWQLGKFGNWRHYATLGTSLGTYLDERSIQPQGAISGFVQGGYGIERPLTPTLWLRVAPTVQYGLGTINAHDGLFQIRPYTYGLTIGLRR